MSDYSSSQNQQNFSQSASFAQALQRAKQIAAKIQPNQQGQKRSIEDSLDSESKKFGGSDYGSNASSPNAMSPAAMQMQAAAQAAAQVAARLAQSNPNQHNSNSSSSGAVSPQDAVQRARELINKMVHQQPQQPNGGGGGNRAGFGSQQQHNNTNNFQQPYSEIMIPGAKVGLVIGKGGETIKQLQEKTGAKMVVIQDGPGQEMEKPLRISGDPDKVEHAKQLVYELIQDKEQFQPRQPAFNSGGEQFEVDCSIFVPKAAVGVVIGKGGDMIKKIQGETGCKLQFIQGKGDGPGDRRCIVQGSKQQVDDGKQMIEELIESVLRRNSEGGGYQGRGGQGNGQGNGGGGGGGGGGPGGQSQDNTFSSYTGPSVVREEYQFTVPASKCGIIIGRGGDTIKQINQQSGAHCEMDRKVSAAQTTEKTFSIKGEQHQIDEAKRLIQDKINLELELTHVGSQTVPANQGYGGGAGGGQNAYQQAWGGYAQQSWDPQQAAAAQIVANVQQAGQPDYSQQWIDYYKQMGMVREAEMIEQQVKARQAGAAPAAAPVSMMQQQQQQQAPAAPNGTQQNSAAAAQAQADYSAEWAEYYRSIGKMQEAEAIEKQIQASKMQAGAAGGGYPANMQAAGNPQMPGGYAQYQQFYAAAGGQPAAQQQQQQQQQPAYPNYGQYAGQYGQGGQQNAGGGGNDNKN